MWWPPIQSRYITPIIPKNSLVLLLCNHTFSIPSFNPQQLTDLLSITEFCILRISYKWNQVGCDPLKLVCFNQKYPWVLIKLLCGNTEPFLFIINTQYDSIVPPYICWPTEEHLSGFQFLTIMNKAAKNICIQVFVWM